MTTHRLRPPRYSDEEIELIVGELLTLKKTQIAEFLQTVELPTSGTKETLRARIESHLTDGSLSPSAIVQFLDVVTPWGKQHVFLYRGPKSRIDNWRKEKWLEALLEKHQLGKYLNAQIPVGVPKSLKLSSIEHDSNRLRITAIKKREGWDRDREYDDASETEEGEAIELRAFVRRVTRGLVAFEWDLTANMAFLQISQLPTGIQYDDVANEFFDLISPWLDIRLFSMVDLRQTIKSIHKGEETKSGEVRSHGIDYKSLKGRKIHVSSGATDVSVLGEEPIDGTLRHLRESGVGHLGNFYWLPGFVANPVVNPLTDEIHAIVVGARKRINFPTPNTEPIIRYVLSRIRSHSTPAS